MKIHSVKAHAISIELDRKFWVSRFPLKTASEIIVEIRTDDGATGYGVIHGRPIKEILGIVQALEGELVGMDALAHEDVWWKIFSLTTTRYGYDVEIKTKTPMGETKRPQILAALAGIDIAMWDLKGKLLKLPIWRLLGGTKNQVFAYATGGYYEEGDVVESLHDEMTSYITDGFKAVKIKVGMISIEDDAKRVAEARKALGKECLLMLDANCAYTLEDATRAIHAFEPYDIFWFEEPLHWYDSVRGLGRLATRTTVPIASGESEVSSWACRDLVDLGGVRVMQFDSTRAGGVTEWLRISTYCQAHGVMVSPHHDPQIHGHVAAAAPNCLGVETFSRTDRDPIWEGLFDRRPVLKNGMLHLSDDPGFGVEINWDFVKRHQG
jgi:L-alanine-DL-glutamate epimerase-like enolase superfamily enzyme